MSMLADSISLDDRVGFSQDVMFQDMAGEAVLLNLRTGYYYGLDEIGTRIWSLLNSYRSIDQVYTTLLTEYDVTEDDLERDLLALIDDLCSHGLLSIVRG